MKYERAIKETYPEGLQVINKQVEYFEKRLIKNVDRENNVKFALFCISLVKGGDDTKQLLKEWFWDEAVRDAIRIRMDDLPFVHAKRAAVYPFHQSCGEAARQAIACILSYPEIKERILLYFDVLMGKKVIVLNQMLLSFCTQDADKVESADCAAMCDYVQGKYEIDLTELLVHPRIFITFLRNQTCQ